MQLQRCRDLSASHRTLMSDSVSNALCAWTLSHLTFSDGACGASASFRGTDPLHPFVIQNLLHITWPYAGKLTELFPRDSPLS